MQQLSAERAAREASQQEQLSELEDKLNTVTAERNGLTRKIGSIQKDIQKFVVLGLPPAQIEALKQQNESLGKKLQVAQEGELLAKQEKVRDRFGF